MGKRVQPRIDLILELQPIAERLRGQTDAIRTNVRIQTTSDHNYPVLAEALAKGVFSLTGGMSMLGYQGADIHNAPTVRLMRTTGTTIVQRDTQVDPPLVPQARDFGGQAGQMLAPVKYDGNFCGFIAVHGSSEPRDWSEQDQAALAQAVTDVEAVLSTAAWFNRPDVTPLTHLIAVLSDTAPAAEQTDGQWYSDTSFELVASPGWTAGRRFVRAGGDAGLHARHLTLFELSTTDAGEALRQLRTHIEDTATEHDELVILYTPINERIESK